MVILLTDNIVKESNKELSQTREFSDKITDWMSDNAG